MQILRTTIEVEAPWLIHPVILLGIVRRAITAEFASMPHQAQIVRTEESSNTQIGEVTVWP
jgi:hypothetical protein